MGKLTKVIKSPSTCYVVIRYFTYAIQFINAIVLANVLGDTKFGIYCFVMLTMQYMSYMNLGLSDSLNIEYASCANDKCQAREIWDTSWSLNIILNALLSIIIIPILLFTNIFEEYEFKNYCFILFIYCITFNSTRLYITFYKLHGKLFKLNIQQLLPNIAILISAFYLKSKLTVVEVVWIWLICNIISLVIFRINIIDIPHFRLNTGLAKVLLKRGITLLLYNLSYYMITLVASSMVSAYFSVEQFGCYSFANTMTQGIIMAAGAFSFIYYPKMINRMSNGSNNDNKVLINKIRSVFIVFIDCISFLSIFGALILSWLLPQYKEIMVSIFSLLIVGQIINNSTTGYAALIIAKREERILIVYSLISVATTFIISSLFLLYEHNIYIVPINVCLASLIYAMLVTKKANDILGDKKNLIELISEIFSYTKWLPCLIIYVNAIYCDSIFLLILGILLYATYNFKNIKNAILTAIEIVGNKDSLKI